MIPDGISHGVFLLFGLSSVGNHNILKSWVKSIYPVKWRDRGEHQPALI